MADLSEVVPQATAMVDIPAPPKAANGQKPTPFIDRVLRLERGARKSFHATWWDENGEECWVWFRPFTLADADAVEARNPKTPTERLVLTIIQKSETAEGARLFEYGHRHQLLQEVAAQHLQELADAILGLRVPATTVEEAREELGKTSSSPSD